MFRQNRDKISFFQPINKRSAFEFNIISMSEGPHIDINSLVGAILSGHHIQYIYFLKPPELCQHPLGLSSGPSGFVFTRDRIRSGYL